MPTNKQRRDAQRRHLERQLQRRREREVRRRKTNLVLSIVGTLVVVAAIVLSVVLIGSSGNDNNSAADTGTPTTSTATTPEAPTTSASPTPTFPPATGKTVSFDNVTVKGATDLKGYPVVTAKSKSAPKGLEVKDLVVGKGKPATPSSSVTVQYTGILYADGKKFDSSWDRGQAATFTLGPGHVIDGFTQGIGGTKGVAPMKEGGRRIIIMPSALGYGPNGSPPTIPGNAALVFVVDLKTVNS